MLFTLFLLIVAAKAQDDEDTSTFSSFIVADAPFQASVQNTLDNNIGFVFGIPCSNRTEWNTRKSSVSSDQLRSGISYLGTPQPPWSDSVYLDFYNSGNSVKGQAIMVNRNIRLFPLALAECVYWNGTFAAQLNQELLSILTQPTWVWPGNTVIVFPIECF